MVVQHSVTNGTKLAIMITTEAQLQWFFIRWHQGLDGEEVDG